MSRKQEIIFCTPFQEGALGTKAYLGMAYVDVPDDTPGFTQPRPSACRKKFAIEYAVETVWGEPNLRLSWRPGNVQYGPRLRHEAGFFDAKSN